MDEIRQIVQTETTDRQMLCLRQQHALNTGPIDETTPLRMTDQPFVPAIRVEFSATGSIPATQLSPNPPRTSTRRTRRRYHSGPVYVIECSTCGEKFRRRRTYTTLRPHETPDGCDCYGRHGYLVDTEYG